MEKWGLALRIVGVGFYIAFCLIGGVLGGLWIDGKFNTKPIFLLLGLILGLVVAFWGVYQMLLPLLNSDNHKRR